MKQNTPRINIWSPRMIRYQLRMKGILPKDIAQAHGWSAQLVTATIRGARQGRKPRQAVADALGIPVTEIWPDALLPLRERKRLRSAS